MFHSSCRITPLCVAVLLSSVLAGCGAKDGSSKSASQVAVKVNKEEISVHQINSLLSRGGNIPQDQIENARTAVVERLIDQELLVQQAKERKLERKPNVMQMIEMSQREILARAYGEDLVSNMQRPTEAQISDFYDKNPELFSKRRVYVLQEINIQASAEQGEEVRKRLQSGGSLQQLTSWLDEQKISFAANAGTKAAEQLPSEILKELARLNPGQAFATRTPTGVLLLFVGGVQEDPIDRARARPAIENYLSNQARGERIKDEIKRLREAAVIEYVGGFAPPSATAAPTQADPVSPPPAEAASEDSISSAIEKGAAKLR